MTKTAYIDFQAVRAALDFKTVLSHYGIKHVGTGDQVKIVCPFHDDHKPSCGVNFAKGVFNCFSCGAKGNTMEFVARKEDHDPDTTTGIRQGAIAGLEIMGLDIADFGRDNGKTKDKKKPSKKKKAKSKKAKVDKKQKPNPKADTNPDTEINPPLKFELDLQTDHPFFEPRGITLETIERFGLGYCNKGIMAGRICIPLLNAEGQLVAYAGRYAADDLPEDTLRYKLPKGFQKAHVLYNMHRIQNTEAKHLVIVEGFWSVFRLDALGIPAVATMGTSLTDEHVEQIVGSNIKFVTVIFDGDEAGHTGAKDAATKLSEHLYVRQLVLPDGIKPDTMSDEYLARLQ